MFSYYIKYGIRYSLRYILKYFIRLVIFFALIFLISFLSGKHLFIANVHAESETHTYSIPVSGAIGWTSNNNNSIDLTQYLTQRFTFGNVIYVGNSQGADVWNEFCGIYNLSNIKSGYYDISVGSYFKGTTGSQNLLVSINNSSYNTNFNYLNFNGISGTNSSNPVIGSIGASKSNVYLNNGYYRVCYRFLDSVSLSGAYGFSNLSLNSSSNNSFVSEQQKTTSAIDENTKSQEKTNNTIKDDNVDSSTNQGSSFFNDFNSGDEGSLTDIVSLPLEYVQHLNDTCKPFTIPTGKLGNISIPCLSSIWSNTSFAPIINTASLIINGIICYKLLTSLFLFFKELKDPDDDKVEVMNL